MAGFKYKKFSFTGGSAEFPSGTSASDIQTKERAIVKGFADALIAMNIGWGCDTTRNATTSDFVDVPGYTSTNSPGLFLVNAASGCKLFIAYVSQGTNNSNFGMRIYDSDGVTKILPPDSMIAGAYDQSYLNAGPCLCGFIMSMIPEGSQSNFGSTFNSSFLPEDATRLCGSMFHRFGESIGGSITYTVYSGSLYTFSIFATTNCVSYSGVSTFYYFCGRILGDLANPTNDTSLQARYGSICFRYPGGSYLRESAGTVRQKTAPVLSSSSANYSFFGYAGGSTFSDIPQNEYFYYSNQICDASGNWITGTATKAIQTLMDETTLSTLTFDNTSNNRPWSPIKVYVFSTDPQNDGVYNGNCFKGYLDTDLFRCSPQFSAGTVLDNGNFVCTGTGCLTLGWDPSNESW